MKESTERLSIKRWAEEDRPREKMLQKGVSALSNAELLAILIGSGTVSESAVQLSQRILHSAGNDLDTLGKLSVKDLINGFKGVGQAKAVTIIAALELGKRRGAGGVCRRDSIRSSYDAFRLLYPHLCDLPHEELWVVLTNQSAKVIEKVKISQGGTAETSADLRLIMKAAVRALAAGIILFHNHPSGSLLPSRQDDSLTQRLRNAARLMDMDLSDHIIIAGDHYYSYADEGKIG